LAAELGPAKELHGDEEGIEVDVEDGGGVDHLFEF
jgi:hypothetical protein